MAKQAGEAAIVPANGLILMRKFQAGGRAVSDSGVPLI